ncbi:glycosyl transferase, group 1 [Sulfurimonas gotlandica GD1]|uniref:Glycosyl transferase, group 1 n=1 Tax=Sulfurimonas gotlandica (strain DSM 19862 / JCM 16533 / GD1) TaxID=929558 RepID=B6BIY1_SULGG|nr:glycosyltransferase [Sulfurimonas gotlandica]EDZ62833.1 lipopolysaccharide biosynthesis protein, putative [Sulfurimonas gotlandica GD1]EHP30492.1 glycosyl transferase, group 1 [Sulfurimonas gotlandica GD1]
MELDAISFSKKLAPHMETVLIVKENSFMHDKLENDQIITYETINFSRSFSLSIISTTKKIIKKYGIKNVVFFGASELKSLYFAFLGLDINLIIRHSTTKSTPKKDWFHKLIYSNVNYHISTSKHLERNVEYIIPFGKNSKSQMIYSSFSFNEPKHIEHDGINIVHTGRIADAKGQTDAILACKILIDNKIDFKLFIVGGYDDEYKEKFLKFYKNIDYKDNIEFVGFTDNVAQYLKKADIFMFPSYGEGLSLSFREALANNLICLTYDNTSFPELQDLGLKFHLCKDRDIEDLSKILLSVCKNIDEEKQATISNNNIIQTVFSEEKEIAQYLEILK